MLRLQECEHAQRTRNTMLYVVLVATDNAVADSGIPKEWQRCKAQPEQSQQRTRSTPIFGMLLELIANLSPTSIYHRFNNEWSTMDDREYEQ
jgi:hypothetical protein